MQLLNLHIKDYKRFSNIDIPFYTNEENNIEKKIFNNMKVTALIGENGSGKTTVLSFISKVFKHLQRNQRNIPSDFYLTYRLNENFIELSKEDDNIFIRINHSEWMLLLEYDIKKGYIEKTWQGGLQCKKVTYEDIRAFLPNKVVVSYFDVDYPKNYVHNYIGDKLLCLQEGHTYLANSSLGLDISLGVFRFLEKYYSNVEPYFKVLMDSLGLNFSNNVCAYFTMENGDIEDIRDDIKEILFSYNVKHPDNLIDKIISYEYINSFFISDSDNVDILYKKFDLRKFINSTRYNSKVLEYLIDKRIFYINDFYIKQRNFEYSMSKMSTGEKMLLGRIFFILSKLSENDVIIIEEPEIHLNYSWIKQILSIFIILFRDYKSHFIISSHNYPFINNLFSNQILVMDEKKIANPNFKTLLCVDEELNYRVFKKSNIKSYIEYYVQMLLLEDNFEELKMIFEYLGESYTKIKIFKKLIEAGIINVENYKQ